MSASVSPSSGGFTRSSPKLIASTRDLTRASLAEGSYVRDASSAQMKSFASIPASRPRIWSLANLSAASRVGAAAWIDLGEPRTSTKTRIAWRRPGGCAT